MKLARRLVIAVFLFLMVSVVSFSASYLAIYSYVKSDSYAPTNAAPITTEDKTLIVGVGGDYATIQESIDSLPKFIEHVIIIEICAGEYNEDVHIDKLYGSGYLYIRPRADDVVKVNSFDIEDCSMNLNIYIDRMEITSTIGTAVSVSMSRVTLTSLTIITPASKCDGIRFYCATGVVHGCTISNHLYGVIAEYTSSVFLNLVSGEKNVVGICSVASTVYATTPTVISGEISRLAQAGGVISE